MEENVCVGGGSRENMTLEVGRERRRGGRERFCRAGRLARLPLELLGSLPNYALFKYRRRPIQQLAYFFYASVSCLLGTSSTPPHSSPNTTQRDVP